MLSPRESGMADERPGTSASLSLTSAPSSTIVGICAAMAFEKPAPRMNTSRRRVDVRVDTSIKGPVVLLRLVMRTRLSNQQPANIQKLQITAIVNSGKRQSETGADHKAPTSPIGTCGGLQCAGDGPTMRIYSPGAWVARHATSPRRVCANASSKGAASFRTLSS